MNHILLPDPRLKIAFDALRHIANTELLDESPDGDRDWLTTALAMRDDAAKAIEQIERMT